MPTIDEIKGAIETLPDAEKSDLKRWLDEIDAEIFDEKIARDAAAGRLDALAEKPFKIIGPAGRENCEADSG